MAQHIIRFAILYLYCVALFRNLHFFAIFSRENACSDLYATRDQYGGFPAFWRVVWFVADKTVPTTAIYTGEFWRVRSVSDNACCGGFCFGYLAEFCPFYAVDFRYQQSHRGLSSLVFSYSLTFFRRRVCYCDESHWRCIGDIFAADHCRGLWNGSLFATTERSAINRPGGDLVLGAEG